MAGFGRISEYLGTLVIILSLNFFLPRALPGDPLIQLTSETYDGVVRMTAEQRAHYRAYYGLDQPLHRQYYRYLRNLLKGNFGHSLVYNMPVADIIFARLPWTAFLALTSLGVNTFCGVLLGAFSAFYRHRPVDQVLYFSMIALSETPAFILGIVFLFLFSVHLKLFPLFGAYSYYHEYDQFIAYLADIGHHAMLPILTLSITRVGGMYLLARNSVIATMSKAYLRTAQAKGLSTPRIIIRHVLRNAMLPVVTRVFLSIGAMVGSTILVENVFAYPGLGLLMREAVTVRDFPLIQGIFLVITVFTLSANLIADLVYPKLDPRLRQQRA